MRKTSVFVYALALGLPLMSACSRDTAEKSKIVFQVPASEGAQQKLIAASTGDSSYTIEPESIDDLNCFYVIAAGPEDVMSNLKCGIKKPDLTISEVLRGGIIVGGVRRSSANETATLEADIPQGTGRHFYLLGVKRKDSNDCFPLGDRTAFAGVGADSVRSNIYLLGHSAPVDLEGGKIAKIDIPMVLTADSWIDGCSRTEINAVSPNPLAEATKMFLSKSTLPSGARASENKCQPFEIELRNDLGVSATLSAIQTAQLELSTDNDSDLRPDGFSVAPTFVNYSECNNNVNSQLSFDVPAGSSSVLRWLKTPPKVSSGDDRSKFFLRLSSLNSSLTPAHFLTLLQAYTPIINTTSAFYGYQILGPRQIATNQCTGYQIDIKKPLGNALALSTKPYKFDFYSSLEGPNYKVYSDPACLTEITTAQSNTYSIVYLKSFKAQGEGRVQFVVKNSADDGTTTLGNIEITTVGNANPSGAMVLGPKVILPGVCSKFTVNLKNVYGGSIANSSATPKSVGLVSTPSVLFATGDCTTPASTMTTYILPGQNAGVFYLKGSGSGNITVTVDGVSFNFAYAIENFLL